ncbi:hypothetical protein PAXINDRAFT_13225 [Paxillus involutus ATCC 200175]|uniref:Uncharacterized protein n=1 Tax=Paxillus involutus ATCC 200175 TaxID=664439 RepID=A0A0C9TE79_PAXIN|nr:hypothetical protein PAXINDRAFT_13225 [Paxillus involutus ATCC 200175]
MKSQYFRVFRAFRCFRVWKGAGIFRKRKRNGGSGAGTSEPSEWYYLLGLDTDNPRPTHVLHLTSGERARFEEIVAAHPNAKPSQLFTGVSGLNGPGVSISEISPVLVNVDRIKAELRRMRQMHSGKFEDNFAKFENDHPDFIVYSQFGAVSVVIMQTPFMASTLIKDFIDNEAINGIVSDAAHGFWKEAKNLLIFSSTFSPTLERWVPALMTYANGATQEHYRLHFLALFESMAIECERRQLEVDDDLFANVVDFSKAERLGFTLAFISFWENHKNSRSQEELHKAASKLLKGCQQHFRSQVTRISKISAIVQDPRITLPMSDYSAGGNPPKMTPMSDRIRT